jgi:group I intron endonuclease
MGKNSISCIYLIVSPTQKIYVGQTIDFRRRMNAYKNTEKIKHQKALKNSLLKYGFDNHKIEILCTYKKCELNNWEKFYIKFFDCFNTDWGLNSTSGGDSPERKKGEALSEDWKQKISQSNKGKKRDKFSKEWIDNLKSSHKKVVKDEKWINNLKIAAKERKERGGYFISEEQKQKKKVSYSKYLQSEKWLSHKLAIGENIRKRFSKPILQYSLNLEFIQRFSSVTEASKALKHADSNISNCANKKVKTAGGYIWFYEVDKEVQAKKIK